MNERRESRCCGGRRRKNSERGCSYWNKQRYHYTIASYNNIWTSPIYTDDEGLEASKEFYKKLGANAL